jgi:hypothetical protein
MTRRFLMIIAYRLCVIISHIFALQSWGTGEGKTRKCLQWTFFIENAGPKVFMLRSNGLYSLMSFLTTYFYFDESGEITGANILGFSKKSGDRCWVGARKANAAWESEMRRRGEWGQFERMRAIVA